LATFYHYCPIVCHAISLRYKDYRKFVHKLAIEQLLRLDFEALRQEPEEIVLRVVALAIARLDVEAEGAVRLERLEACVAALLQAAQAGLPLTRTLAGTMLTLRRDGELALRPEGPRRRGIHPAAT